MNKNSDVQNTFKKNRHKKVIRIYTRVSDCYNVIQEKKKLT